MGGTGLAVCAWKFRVWGGVGWATGDDAKFFGHGFGGGEAGEGGLQEVGSDEDGEPDPVWMHEVGEGEAGEDHGASEGADDVFEFHGVFR